MNKRELIEAIPGALEMGLQVAPTIMLDIFEDEEELPEDFVRIFLRVPEPPPEIVIYMGAGMSDKIDKMLADYYGSKD